jgi:hypothetical protein
MAVLFSVYTVIYAAQMTHRSSSYMCSRCRLVKHSTEMFGIEKAKYERADFTRWYERRFPPHAHQWGWCGSFRHGAIIACGASDPVWQLDQDDHRRFLERATEDEVRRFHALMDAEEYTRRQEALRMVYAKVRPEALKPLFPR